MSKKTKRERAERLFRRKVMIITGVTLALLVVLSFGGWWFFVRQQTAESGNAPDTSVDDKQRQARTKQDNDLRESATEAIKKGDMSSVDTLYRQAIDDASDVTRKVQLYINQSSILYDAGQPEAAIAAAEKAASVSKDQFLVADWLSRIYEDQKEYVKAAEYYTLAGKWADSETNQTALTKTYYDEQAARVKALGGGAQ